MRFGLYLADLSRPRTRSHGIINYSVGLATALADQLAIDEKLILFCNPEIASELPLESSCVETVMLHAPANLMTRVALDQMTSTRRANASNVDLIHYPKGLAPVLTWPKCKVVVTIHDLIPLHSDVGSTTVSIGARRAFFKLSYMRAAQRANAVIANSEIVAQQLREEFGIRSRVIPMGVELGASSEGCASEHSPYLLIFGSTLPHKATAEALEYSVLSAEERGLSVVIIGQSPRTTVSNHPRITHVYGPLPTEEIACWIENAMAVVTSARIEGFGRLPIEAFVRGSTSVFARNPVAEELLDGVPGMYEPGDYISFERAISSVLELPDHSRERLAEELTQRFSWSNAARETLEMYRGLLA